MYVYKITNILNNKVYVGITSRTIEERFKEHKYKINERKHLHLYSSMIKYGKENFKVEELEKCNSLEELFERERVWIEFTKSNIPKFGYNNTNGGEGFEKIKTDDLRILELYKENRSYIKTSKILNYSPSTVRRRLISMGEKLDRGYSNYSKEVLKLYQTPYTIKDICNILDLSNKTVMKILDENNIERHTFYKSVPEMEEILKEYKNGVILMDLSKKYNIPRHRLSRLINYKLKI